MKPNTYEVDFAHVLSHGNMTTTTSCTQEFHTLEEAMEYFKKCVDKAYVMCEEDVTEFMVHIWYWDKNYELHSILGATSHDGFTWAF